MVVVVVVVVTMMVMVMEMVMNVTGEGPTHNTVAPSNPCNTSAAAAVCADQRGDIMFIFGLRVRASAQRSGLGHLLMVRQGGVAWESNLGHRAAQYELV